MKRSGGTLSFVLLGALVAVLLVPGRSSGAEPDDGSSPGSEMVLVADEVLSDDGRLHELTVRSEALGRETNVRVLLPAGYDDPSNASRRYPVLLLVHGAFSSERSWTNASDVEGHTAERDLIVVMPEGGSLGFYSDWLDGPAWETFHIYELLPWIESTYRAEGTREGRAVAGVSMGGFGAMSYAARHPDRFVAVASFSGVVDLAGLGAAEMLPIQLLFAPEPLWGSFLSHEATWRSHNPADLASNLGGVAIRHVGNTGIPCPGDNPAEGLIEVAILAMNTSLDLRLTRFGIPHEMVVHPCGTHEWHHSDAYLADWLPALMKTFDTPPPVPDAFDYRNADHDIDVWGWSFRAHRAAVEFLELEDVSAAGLTVTGSGLVDVVTPPIYRPGKRYSLATSTAGAITLPVAVPLGLVQDLGTLPPGMPHAVTLAAGADGRLRFQVDLGPAHTANQFSPEGIIAESQAVGSYFRTAAVVIQPLPVPGSSTSDGTTAPSPVAQQPAATASAVGDPDGGGTLPATGGTQPIWPAVAVLTAALATRAWTTRQ